MLDRRGSTGERRPAGSSSNPVLFAITVFQVLGWKVAGVVGLDRFLLPALGTPWQAGTLIHRDGSGASKLRPSSRPV